MNNPTAHHFIPAFHISSWKGSDGLVCQMRLIGGSVSHSRRSPSATGFERHLYRTEGVPPEQEQHLESNFFSPVDNDAAIALQEMLAFKRTQWTAEIRSAWTRYILALRFRGPETVKDIKEHVKNMWNAARDSIKEDFFNRRLPTDPDTFEKFEAMLDPAAPSVRATNMIMRMIDNDRVGPTIFNMHWSVHRVEEAEFPLLLSDGPLDWPKGLADPSAHIALPIAPYMIFLAANDTSLSNADLWRSHTNVVKVLNKLSVSQAREYVWGNDSRQIEFVRKHFGSMPMKPAISFAQKASSLQVAKHEKPRAEQDVQ
jgi:hypothetical protein